MRLFLVRALGKFSINFLAPYHVRIVHHICDNSHQLLLQWAMTRLAFPVKRSTRDVCRLWSWKRMAHFISTRIGLFSAELTKWRKTWWKHKNNKRNSCWHFSDSFCLMIYILPAFTDSPMRTPDEVGGLILPVWLLLSPICVMCQK